MISLYGDKYPAHPLHPSVQDFQVTLTENKGMALQALSAFAEGTVMARFDGVTTNILTQHSLTLRPDEFILDTDFIGMLAHSCDPNVALNMRDHLMVALKDIAPGDVLSMDYASTEAELFTCFHCSCGAPNCRGVITGYDQAPPTDPIEWSDGVRPAAEYRGIVWEGTRYYGQHMLISGYACNEDLLDIPFMQDFLVELVDDISMVKFGPAHVHRFGQGHEIGLSGFQLMETSQVSFHSNDAHRDIYLDVFSCKEFDEDRVIAFLKDRLAPARVDYQTAWRR